MKLLTHIGNKTAKWDPWFGCFQISEACQNCYIQCLNNFEDKFYPLNTKGIEEGTLIGVALHTDFFIENADHLRDAAWQVIRDNPHLIFEIYTKRVERIMDCVPDDWGDGYDNVVFCVTTENQKRADQRIPVLIEKVRCKHKWLNCAPLLEDIDIKHYLETGCIESVTTSGERKINGSGRELRFEWLKNLSNQCRDTGTHFEVMFLGSRFVDGSNRINDSFPCFRSPFANQLNLNNNIPIKFNI